MTFDLYILDPPKEWAKSEAETRERFFRELRTANELDPKSEGQRQARERAEQAQQDWAEALRPIRYGGNNGWMSRIAYAMRTFGMSFDAESYVEIPALPTPGDHGITWDDVADETVNGPRKRAFTEALDKVLRWHGPEVPGIPSHKLSSCDGWIVTPVECRSALALWRKAGKPDITTTDRERPRLAEDEGASERWREFLTFLDVAAEYGGFEVR